MIILVSSFSYQNPDPPRRSCQGAMVRTGYIRMPHQHSPSSPTDLISCLSLTPCSIGKENWGLVTYREVDLLIDAVKASNQQKQRVAVVVAHELAHQWFGNLVTMQVNASQSEIVFSRTKWRLQCARDFGGGVRRGGRIPSFPTVTQTLFSLTHSPCV